MTLTPRFTLAAGALAVAAAAGALALSSSPATAASSPSTAASPATSEAVSANWAGYVAQGTTFSSVSGSWVVPSATCSASSAYSAFWVGLGGDSNQSDALEQVGTQSDCTGNGTDYYAWYELVPAAPVRLGLTVKPGDHITGKVTVNGTNVTVSLANQTTGQTMSKTLQTSDIDTSSAEWIAEAPSACDQSGDCQPLSLADFGTVQFTNATATAGGHTGPISDSQWQSQAVALNGSDGAQRFGPLGVSYDASGSAGAEPSTLSGSGSAFSVSWQSGGASSSAGGGGDPYGAGGDGGYGYGGYGYGGYGYGAGGYGGGDGYGGGGYGAGYGGYGGYGYGYGGGGAYAF